MSKSTPHWWREPPLILRYAFAVLLAAGAIGFEQWMQSGATVSLLLCAIIVSTWFGGVGPGLLAVAVALVGFIYFFVPPTNSFAVDPEHSTRVVLLSLVAIFVVWLIGAQTNTSEALKAARDGLQKKNEALQAENVERERREDKLRQQAHLLDLTHDTVFVRDMNDVIIYWNLGAEEQYGYRKEEAIGRTSHTLMQTVFPATLEDVNAELFRTGRWEGELVHTKRGGTRVVVASRWSLQRGEKGEPVAILETNNDITERKRAEAELKKTELRLSAIIASAPVVLFALDRAGTLTLHEGKGLEALGLRPGEAVGKSIFDLYRDEPEIVSNMQRALAGEAFSEMIEVQNLLLEMYYAPFFDHEGTVAGVNGVAMDLTERKRTQEALRDAQIQLAHVNRITTMGQLATSIAHEVNQPVAAVLFNAHAALRFLQATPPDLEESRQALADIVKNGSRAGEVVARIRALIRKTPPQHDWLDVNEAVLEVVALTRDQGQRTGISLEIQLAERLPRIPGDRVQLQQVMLNLIINAFDATSQITSGARKVLIGTHEDAVDGVIVTVKDTGTGIDPERLEGLFEAFYTTKASGMGMGLAICRSIIEAHSGRVWAKPNTPQGAIFQFALPVQRETTL